MSEIILYGGKVSQPTRSVRFFLEVSGIPYTFKLVSVIAGEHLSEEFLKVNPFQTIPAIVHNDFNLWESAAIITYLAETFDTDNEWYPKDLKTRGRINAYLHWHHQNIRAPLMDYLVAKRLSKIRGLPELTEEAEAPLKEGLKNWYETVEWLLSATGFAARTETATIADVFLYNELSVGLLIPMDLGAHVKIQNWFDSIGENPILQELLISSLDYLSPHLS